MLTIHTPRTQICLNEIDFSQDVRDRLLLASLNPCEVEALEEILCYSLEFSLELSREQLDAAALCSLLDKLEAAQALKICGDIVSFTKERRKAIDLLVWRFQECFRPGLDYLRHLVRKIPIHKLPECYALTRTQGGLFESIVHQYMNTPKEYQQHLSEVALEDPRLPGIFEDIFTGPHYCAPATALQDRHDLSDKEYQTLVVQLEFSFAACSGYRLDDGKWVEVLTPVHEYAQYLKQRKAKWDRSLGPEDPPITDQFAFLREVSATLQKVKRRPVACNRIPKSILDILQTLKLVSESDGCLRANEAGSEWLEMSDEARSQSLCHYHRTRYRLRRTGYSERDILALGRVMSHLPIDRWVHIEHFIDSLETGIGEVESTQMVQQGKRWTYIWPEYSNEDRDWLRRMIRRRCWEMGLLDITEIDGQGYMRLTEYGQVQLLRVN